MLNQNLDTNLLSELSDEQQEIVAGGGQLEDLEKKVKTAFEASKTQFENVSMSGPEGSMVKTILDNTHIDTSAFENLTADFG